MATNKLGRNITFPIYNEDGTPFHDLVIRKATVDSVAMSLGDKITGDVYYKDNTLQVTMHEYIEYKQDVDDVYEEPVKYLLVNPPTVVRDGMVSDNGETKGMTKYSFEFYHPMYQLSNMPFTDIAVSSDEEKYLSQNKTFNWVGYPDDYIAKLNKNLQSTEWVVVKGSRFPQDKDNVLSEVLSFNNNTIADALKMGYDTWNVPYVISQISSSDEYYSNGKRFLITIGLPSNEIYETEDDSSNNNPYIFRMGQGVGLKNNSRTPRKNKIITRISGYGSEENIPYGYPQIVWTGDQSATETQDGYPIYKGIVGGAYVNLIKHPFTRTHLMPSIYSDTVNKKVNPYATGYDPTIEIKDYYDASGNNFPNPINTLAPSYDIHEFSDIKPQLEQETISGATPINDDGTDATTWDDSINDNGEYVQGYFKITLPVLSFDLYACAAITQEMQINMRSGACIGCTFTVQVDWDDYKRNFYDANGEFAPYGTQRDYTKYPDSSSTSVSLILQKDTQTFGTLMPNTYQNPNAGDEFVILGISLPLSYIQNAEVRLDNAMQSYMLENNIYYYDYPLKFDEYFLATHTNILKQIQPNTIIHFQYGNDILELFVKQKTIKYGQGVLPQYDITLTDNVEVVLNQIGQVADSVEHLSTLISLLRQGYNQNIFFELAKKLSKTGNDTASGLITFLRGLTSIGQANLLGGAQFGSSGTWTINDEGDANLNEIIANLITATQVDAGTINTEVLNAKAAHFAQLIIDELRSAGGAYLLSAADCTIDYVETLDSNKVLTEGTPSYYRCYYKANDNDGRAIYQKFAVNDQVMHTTFDKANAGENYDISNRYYWMAVAAVSSEPKLMTLEDGVVYPCHWIDLDVNNQWEDSDPSTITATPEVGDDVVLLGHQVASGVTPTQDDLARQYAIYITAYSNSFDTEVKPPAIVFYQGVNNFTLSGKKPNYWGRDKVVITGNLKYSSTGSGAGTDVQDMINASSSSPTVVYQLEPSRVVVKADKDGVTDEHVYLRIKKSQGDSVGYVTDKDYTFSIANSISTIVDKSGYQVNLNPSSIVTQRTSGTVTDAQRGLSSTATNCLFANDTTIIVTLKDGSTILDRQSITLVKDGQDGQDGQGGEGNDQYAFYLVPDTQKVTCSGPRNSPSISPTSLTYTVKLEINGTETTATNYISEGTGVNCSVSVSGTTVTLSNLGSTDKTIGGSGTIYCYTDTAKTKLWGVLTAKFNVSWSSFALDIVDNELTSKATELQADYNGKIESANTSIRQNATDISAQASRISANEASISALQVKANGISANVASQKYNSNLFGFTNGLSFSNKAKPFIMVYGFEVVRSGTGSQTGTITGFGGASVDGVTLSFEACTQEGTANTTIRVGGVASGSSTTIDKSIGDVTNSWAKYSVTFDTITALNSISLIYTGDSVPTVAVRNLKVETGVVATAFCISDSDGTKIEDNNLFSDTTTYNGDPKYNNISSRGENLDTSGSEGYKVVMPFYRGVNSNLDDTTEDDGDTMAVYTFTEFAKPLTVGKVYTFSYMARSGTSDVTLKLLAKMLDVDGRSSTINTGGSFTNYGDALFNADPIYVHKLTTSWKRYYARFYVINSISGCPCIQVSKNWTDSFYYGSQTKRWFYIADVRLEEGYIADESDPMSISGERTRSESKMTLTAQEFSVAVRNEYKEAGLKVTIDGVQFTGNKVGFASSNGIDYIRLGQDSDGIPYFIFYDPQGTPRYNLGYKGLVDLIGQTHHAEFKLRLEYLQFVSTENDFVDAAILWDDAVDNTSETNKVYRFSAQYTIDSNGDKLYTPSEGADVDGLYYETNGISGYLPTGEKVAADDTWFIFSVGSLDYNMTGRITNAKGIVNGKTLRIVNGQVTNEHHYFVEKVSTQDEYGDDVYIYYLYFSYSNYYERWSFDMLNRL